MSGFLLVGLGTALCVAGMAVLWAVGRRIANWSLVDPGWAACLVLLAGLYALLSDGAPLRRGVLAAAVAAWGGRHVALLLVHRVIGHPEEGRYVELRRTWGPGAFFLFFQAQALLAVLLSGPFLLVAGNATDGPHPLELASLALFALALAGEARADADLARWRRAPGNRGKTCRTGLWAWSRHPNYFFEWLVWCAFALAAAAAPGGGWAVYAPILLLLLLLFVTGIPPSERQALRTRGDDYRAYQRTTSAFVPWPPRRG